MNFNGNNNDNGGSSKKYREPETFSGYNLSNVEGVDPSALSFSYFRNLLKCQISPRLPNPTNDKMWDHDNSLILYLTHTKARILREQVDAVLKGEISNGGVPTGADGLISFSDGKDAGSQFYCLILRKIDQNSGSVLSAYVYEFKSQYHYAINNFDQKTAAHEKQYFDMLEIEQFKDLLEEYYKSMTNAYAYSVVNNMRFDMSRINTKLIDIAKANGIEYGDGNRSSGNSFFNKPNNEQSSYSGGSARTSTIEDLESQLN